MKRGKPLLLLCAVLTGCVSQYSLLEPARVKVNELYSVEPQIPWSRAKTSRVEVWTVDGPMLEAIRFFDGLGEGDTLFEAEGEIELPRYDAAMETLEIQEFVVDSMVASGAVSVQPYDLRPWDFGRSRGFRFEMDFKDENGLQHKGFVVGSEYGEKLYIIMYTGTQLYCFPKYRGAAEGVVSSIELEA